MTLPTYKYWYGVDPGARGAVACVSHTGSFLVVRDLPTTNEEWLEWLQYPVKPKISYCTCENVHALPGQSTVAGFTFGKNVAKAELLAELLTTCESPLLVSPQKWKKFFGLDKDKHKSVELARELFPEASDYLLKSKDGRAEALLIAEYGRRTYKGEL